MTQIKADLICEIIRISQTNFLNKKEFGNEVGSDQYEKCLMEWIRSNAGNYREHFRNCLDKYSATELGEILKELTGSQKDLNNMLNRTPAFTENETPSNPAQ